MDKNGKNGKINKWINMEKREKRWNKRNKMAKKGKKKSCIEHVPPVYVAGGMKKNGNKNCKNG